MDIKCVRIEKISPLPIIGESEDVRPFVRIEVFDTENPLQDAMDGLCHGFSKCWVWDGIEHVPDSFFAQLSTDLSLMLKINIEELKVMGNTEGSN